MWSRCLLTCHIFKLPSFLFDVLASIHVDLVYGGSQSCLLIQKTAVYFVLLDGSPVDVQVGTTTTGVERTVIILSSAVALSEICQSLPTGDQDRPGSG